MHQRWTYAFEIPMNDFELVKVDHARNDLGELNEVVDEWGIFFAKTASGLTNRKRFASGFDLAYFVTFPLGIHSVRMWKRRGLVDTKTPNNGKMFGWDKCFQPMISRHNRWGESQATVMNESGWRYLEDPVGVTVVHLETFYGHRGPQVLSTTHVCKPTMTANPPDTYELLLNKVGGGYDALCSADLGKEQ